MHFKNKIGSFMIPQGPSSLKRGYWRLEAWLGLGREELCGLWSQLPVGVDLALSAPGVVRTLSYWCNLRGVTDAVKLLWLFAAALQLEGTLGASNDKPGSF